MRRRNFAYLAVALLTLSGPLQASPAAPVSSTSAAWQIAEGSKDKRDDDDTLLYVLGGAGVLAVVVVLLGVILDNDINAKPLPGPPLSP